MQRKATPRVRCCNLCGRSFRAPHAFARYCRQCKEQEEVLKYSEWLPELDGTLPTKVSA